MPLPMSTMHKCDQDPEYFRDEILSKFRDTEHGRLCQTDTFEAVGKFNYDRQRKDPSKASLARKGLKFVLCLIPEECVKPLRRLASPETRANAGVHPENMFLFPSTDLFASTDASEPEREAFYEHMGHSESKAVREVFEIKNFLHTIDKPNQPGN